VPDVLGDYAVFIMCLPPGREAPEVSVLDNRNVMGPTRSPDLLGAWEVDTLRDYAVMGPVAQPVTLTPSEPASPTTVADSTPTPTPPPIPGQPTVTG
jgi:hypothetical protein